MTTNCYEIVGRELSPGISMFRQTSPFGYFVDVNNAELQPGANLSIRFLDGSEPPSGNKLFQARLPRSVNGHTLDAAGRFDGFIISFASKRLDFQGPYTQGANWWSGGETWFRKRPIWRIEKRVIGDRRHRLEQPHKVEGWALSIREECFIGDCRSGVMILRATRKQGLLLERPEPMELVGLLHHKARNMHHERGRNWIRQNLRALSYMKGDERLANCHGEVENLFPPFRP